MGLPNLDSNADVKASLTKHTKDKMSLDKRFIMVFKQKKRIDERRLQTNPTMIRKW